MVTSDDKEKKVKRELKGISNAFFGMSLGCRSVRTLEEILKWRLLVGNDYQTIWNNNYRRSLMLPRPWES
jgi:predicted Fe-S protein YdhL (DUF1289 family)